MTANLQKFNEDIKKGFKKHNVTKKSVLVALAALLISCGGGGGGGSSTSSATPTTPDTGTSTQPSAPVTTKPTVTTTSSGLTWNDTTFSYDKDNPHNNSNTTLTGSGVKIGIIDVGFQNSAFDSDLTTKFGSRLTKLTVSGFTAESTSDDDHGIIVADLAAGSSAGIAKGATVYVIDSAKKNSSGKTYPAPTLAMYQALANNGVTIYNQSFGIDGVVTEFNSNSSSSYYYGYQIGTDMLNFYKNAVNNGSLFVWAAGNDSSDTQPTLEGGLPYFESGLESGWINVVALTSKVESKLGDTSWDNLTPLSPAGVAKNWTVTAVGDQTFTVKGQTYVGGGSSFAAPLVTGTAALLKEKYPWMDASLIRQTILSTATDIGATGVDEVYGWGLLNID